MRRVWVGLAISVGCGRFGFGEEPRVRDGAVNDASPTDVTADAFTVCHSGTWSTPTRLDLSTTSEDGDPSVSPDERTLYFESNRSPSLGRAVWFATRPTRNDPFGTPDRIVALDDAADDVDPEIADDGLTLYFTSNRSGSYEILYATRALVTDPFVVQGPVTVTGDSAITRSALTLSGDGQLVFFARDLDVAVGTRTSVSSFAYERLIAEVNAPPTDGNPSITADGLELFFDSYRNGPPAIFVATRASTADVFSALTELTTLPDGQVGAGSPKISHDGRTLYYWINVGSQIDLHTVTRSCD